MTQSHRVRSDLGVYSISVASELSQVASRRSASTNDGI